MNLLDFIREWINANPGKAVGVFLGALFGILVLTIGAVKTILVILFIVLGYLIGKLKDDNSSLAEFLSGIFRKK